MKALILNSGSGSRMGDVTKQQPKCMTTIDSQDTILSRQLRILSENEITDVVITTGAFSDKLEEYCKSLLPALNITFVYNPEYLNTNYIYSIYLAEELLKEDDILLMHGDLVFERGVLAGMLGQENSCMAVCGEVPLPEKDFKAVIRNGRIEKIGIEFFQDAVAAQPLYRLLKKIGRFGGKVLADFVNRAMLNVMRKMPLMRFRRPCIYIRTTWESCSVMRSIIRKTGRLFRRNWKEWESVRFT